MEDHVLSVSSAVSFGFTFTNASVSCPHLNGSLSRQRPVFLQAASCSGPTRTVRQDPGNVDAANQLAVLEAHAQQVDAKLQVLCKRNDELREQRDAARQDAQNIAAELKRVREEARTNADRNAEERMQLVATLAHREKHLAAMQDQSHADLKGSMTVRQGISSKEISAIDESAVAGGDSGPLARVKAELETVSRKLEERRAAVVSGEIRARQLEYRVQELQNKLARAESLIREHDAAALDLENQLSVAERQLREYKIAEEEAKHRLATLSNRVETLERGANEAAMQLEAKDWRIEDLTAQVADLKQVAQQARQAAEGARVEVSKAVNRSNVLSAEREHEVEDGLRMLQTVKRELDVLKTTAAEKEEIMAGLRAELKSLRDSGEAAKKSRGEAKALQVEVERLKMALAESQKTCNLTEENMRKQSSDMERRLTAAQAAGASASAEAERLRADVAAAHASEKAAQRDLRAARAELLALQNKLQSMPTPEEVEAALGQQREQLHAAHAAALEGFADARQEEQTALEARVAAVVKEAEAAAKAREETERALKAAQDKSETMESRLAEVHAQLKTVRQELKAERKEAKATKHAANKLKEERLALMESMEQLQGALKNQEERNAAFTNDLQAMLLQRETELAEANARMKATEDLLERLAAARRQGAAAVGQGEKENGSASPTKSAKNRAQKAPLAMLRTNSFGLR
jgi:chromosome segregation ATPase